MSAEDRVVALAASIASRSEPGLLDGVDELISSGEWGVAFESICDAVYEAEVPLFDGEICEFEVLGAYLASVSPFPDRGVWRMVSELRATDEVSRDRPTG